MRLHFKYNRTLKAFKYAKLQSSVDDHRMFFFLLVQAFLCSCICDSSSSIRIYQFRMQLLFLLGFLSFVRYLASYYYSSRQRIGSNSSNSNSNSSSSSSSTSSSSSSSSTISSSGGGSGGDVSVNSRCGDLTYRCLCVHSAEH